MISIIVPVGTEDNIEQYQNILTSIKQQTPHQENVEYDIIWVGGHSTIKDWLLSQGEVHIEAPDLNRAARMNLGIKAAKNECIVLHHPRSILQEGALVELSSHISSLGEKEIYWGCFTHKFKGTMTPLKRFTSWYSNHIRCDVNKVVYLDHCFYLSKQMYQKIELLPEEDIYEDTLLSYRLREVASPKRMSSISLTSDIRFKKKGFARQALLNQYTKILFYCGVPLPKINKIYERGLWLN